MSDDAPPELQPELLDDFYTECDELMGHIRAHLDVLALRLGSPADYREALASLYRSVHSFKGICSIVGLRPAEQLAHAAEEVLRRLSSGESAPTAETFNLIGRSAHRLEQIVACHRLKQPQPEIADLLEPLHAADGRASRPPDATTPSSTESESAAGPPADVSPLVAHSEASLWHATFSPSAELTQRGVNVTSIRERLSVLGTIRSAAPTVRGDGSMSFEFILAVHEPPAAIDAWLADGVVLSPTVPVSDGRGGGGDYNTAGPNFSIAPSHIVRVDLGRLDHLMRIMGEMVIHRSRLEERIAQLPGDRSALQEVNLGLGRSLKELRAAITRVRLVPVAEIFSRLPFVVRDLARETGKKVRLVLEGRETEIDKFLVERLKEPLLHLVRNAVSHGVESPAERVAAGKPEEAILSIRASAVGHAVVIRIRDDGRGIDPRSIALRAAALGIALPETPSAGDILAVLCRPGFSTREEADLTSGRGVGMSVVHTTVRELGGMLSLDSAAGTFTQFTLRLPLTLSIADMVIVIAGAQTCAVPQSFIEEIVQFEEEQVRSVKHVEVIPYRDGVLPLVRLSRVLGTKPRTHVRIPALVISSERGSAALVVDRVVAQREVVVRPMSDPLLHVRGVSGATELGDGRPVLILDAAALTAGVVRPHTAEKSKPWIENAKPAS